MPSPSKPQTPEQVLPLIQHVWYPRSFVPRAAEQTLRGKDPDDLRPVVRPLISDLLVSYAIAGPRGYADVTVNQARDWGMDANALHGVAVDNLRKHIKGKLRTFAFQTFRAVHTGEELEASTLLLDEVWDQCGSEISGDLRVVVAARPMLAFTGSETWGEDGGKRFSPRQCLAMMAGSASLVKSDFAGKTLSDQVLERTAGEWKVFTSLREAESTIHG